MGTSITETLGGSLGGVRGNTTEEKKWVQSLPKEMRTQAESQLQVQKEQELIQQIAQMMKQVGELSKSMTRNVGV
jgi:uncharacterized coiled-coil DUF342 family protein